MFKARYGGLFFMGGIMTQLEAARQGIVTKEMETAARDEGVPAEYIRQGWQKELLSFLPIYTTNLFTPMPSARDFAQR